MRTEQCPYGREGRAQALAALLAWPSQPWTEGLSWEGGPAVSSTLGGWKEGKSRRGREKQGKMEVVEREEGKRGPGEREGPRETG